MLAWALVFMIIAMITAAFAFTGLTDAASGVARTFFAIFFLLTLVMFALSVARDRRETIHL